MKFRLGEWIGERLAILSGAFVLFMIGVLFYYLAGESVYAFDRKFPFGWRVGLFDTTANLEDAVGFDPNNTLLTCHPDGLDGLDEKEELSPLSRVEDLVSTGAFFATGSPLTDDLNEVQLDQIYRDDWRAMKTAGNAERFYVFGFASPEYKKPTMLLRWEPDAGFKPDLAPYRFVLRLERAPAGVQVKPFEIDLSKTPSGKIELPTFIARTDAERTQGYLFELVASPTTRSNILATIGNFAKPEWDPTAQYARFGFLPLLTGSLLITLVALIFAAPVGVWCAVYISEQAPIRLREWLKPIVELLASVPTVVLGYFGLMLVAPWLLTTFGKALQMDSGRNLMTAAIMMAVLILPTIISVAEDALRSVPQSIRDGSVALGFSATETIRKVLLPAARAGIIAAVLLGFARAIGETMIIWILSGGTPFMPALTPQGVTQGLFRSTSGIPDRLGIETPNVEFEQPHYGHLFLLGVLLFAITTAVNLIGFYMARRRSWQL